MPIDVVCTSALQKKLVARCELNPVTGCWDWQGSLSNSGYGTFCIGNERFLAHRASYALFVGAIPPGLEVRHRCDRPSCVNPSHLEPGSHAQNMRDMADRGRGGGRPYPKGEAHHAARLTAADVLCIREAVASGRSMRALAGEYGVSNVQIGHVASGRHWGDVGGPLTPAKEMAPRLDASMRAAIVALVDAGEGVAATAARFGVSRDTVGRIMLAHRSIRL